ncbi:MAG: CCA tRNA nucleotidyltransferase [Dehalococcoidia bacterium]|nr:CCA tRNA nucleotidyltransferase [Dehalococcoidia bacterium]
MSPSETSLISTLSKLREFLAQQSYDSYIVGGFIRDWLLGRQTNDVDVAVNGNALSIAENVAESLGGKFVLLDDVNSIARVIVVEKEQQWHLDFSSFDGDIESDLARRDFTINALAMELGQLNIIASAENMNSRKLAEFSDEKQSQLKLIDPFSGKRDLENGMLRAVSQQIFQADAVRLLRAVRLAAELDFTIETDTENLIRNYSQYITRIPGERIREELLRLLAMPRAAYHIRYLDELGLLLSLIPELAEAKGVEQPTVHFWDVFDHSVETVAAIEFLTRESKWKYGREDMLATAPWSDIIDAHISQEISSGSSRKTLLKLGGLLHDIAKPRTKSLDDTGRAHFLGHAKEGADMTTSILGRLRFSNREINFVESLVYHHLRPAQMANKELPTQRAIYRYFRDTGDDGIDILILALADYLAVYGPLVSTEEWKGCCALTEYILTENEKQQAKVLPVKLVDGNDLMNLFDLSPGPLVGELLVLVREAQASGELNTTEEALALVRKELDNRALRSEVIE